MASAVAVDASASGPRLPDNLSDDDAEFAGKVGPIDSDDEVTPKDSVEDNGGLEEDDDDLFGDGGDDEEEDAPKHRTLDDEELDSGDDEGRADRIADDANAQLEEEEQQSFNFMDADIARHAIPEPSDGELYLLKVPHFLAIEPMAWNHKTFQPPTTDHHSKVPASDSFSAFNTAMSTIRWRRSPSNPADLQSNARILRWSDGSLTLQFASDPMSQYEITSNILAPPQHNPSKPTPTSISYKAGRPPTLPEFKESYTYLAAPYEEANVMRFTNKFTTSLLVNPSNSTGDSALEQLQNAFANIANKRRDNQGQDISFVKVEEDPELKRQREEANFKEKQKQLRQREKHEQRQRERVNRTLGRSGARGPGYGLSLGNLEDEEGGGSARKSRAKTGLRRDWSSDEDYGGAGRTREDEYDEEDDFIAASDEELEIVDDDDDDDGIMEPSRGGGTPKKSRRGDEEDEDVVTSTNRVKRRRVIDEDDEDE